MYKYYFFVYLNKSKIKNKDKITTNKKIISLKYFFCFAVSSAKLTYSSSKFVLMLILYVYKIMDISKLQYIYRNRFLVTIDGNVYVYKYEKYKIDKPFLSFNPKHIFLAKSKVCEMTEFCGAEDKEQFDGKTLLLECEDNEYV